MRDKFFSNAQSAFQHTSHRRSNNNFHNRRSKSLDQRPSRRSPTRLISFQIRDKKEIVESPKQEYVEQSAFDPWGTSFSSATGSFSPTSIADLPTLTENENEPKTSTKSLSPNFSRSHTNKASSTMSPFSQVIEKTPRRKSSNRIIPGVSQMTMRQTLAVIFSAFWERADLYTDVLGLDHDKPSARQLRLAFFRQGRTVLATPIESPDDMTTIDAGVKPIFAVGGGSVSNEGESRNIVQSGVKVSRKAKIKFQAINLAYDLLSDLEKRKTYNEWRLWHCRLPDPMEFERQKEQKPQDDFEEQNQYQKLTNQELNDIMKEGKYNNQDQRSFDSGTSTTDESSAMGSSTNSKSSLPSILREPKFGKRFRRKNQRSTNKSISSFNSSDRRIRWNEEVEELVILECSRDQSYDSSPHGNPSQEPCTKDFPKENVDPLSNVSDPYQNQSIEDDWLKQNNTGSSSNNVQDSTSFNFQSLQDSRLTFVEAHESAGRIKGSLDDSLIAILDAPNPASQVPQSTQSSRPWPKTATTEPEQESLKPGHRVVADDTYHVGRGNKNNVKINVRSFQKEKRGSSSTLQESSTNVQETFKAVEDKDLFHRYKEAQCEIDVDDYSIDTKSTKDTYDSNNWRSQGQSTDCSFSQHNDCAIFGQSNDCSPFGRSNDCSSFSKSNECRTNDCGSIDLAKGFQATLSNYINAAVSDMKEGLVSLGKKLEENVPKMSENGDNPFTLNSFELDAMMNILKVEMSTIPPHMNMKGRNCTG